MILLVHIIDKWEEIIIRVIMIEIKIILIMIKNFLRIHWYLIKEIKKSWKLEKNIWVRLMKYNKAMKTKINKFKKILINWYKNLNLMMTKIKKMTNKFNLILLNCLKIMNFWEYKLKCRILLLV